MAIEAGTQTLVQEGTEEDLQKRREYWEAHRHTSEAGVEVANRNLARIALQAPGQLQLELPVSEETLL